MKNFILDLSSLPRYSHFKMTNPWGESQTRFFFDLTPEKVLDTLEQEGLQPTGRCMALGSYENRVYEVELEKESLYTPLRTPSDAYRILKFYRPGRWTKEQILEEHEFLHDLKKEEVPVIPPIEFEDGNTLKEEKQTKIYYSMSPKQSGRSPSELQDEQIKILGRLLARIHQVGSTKKANHRIVLNEKTYGLSNLEYLLNQNKIPLSYESVIRTTVKKICEISSPWFIDAPKIRIHGDCHYGNLIDRDGSLFFVDFDDFVTGPEIQDLWLLLPGRDNEAKRQFQLLLESYESMRDFDRKSLRLIEPLRALRMIHFAAWISKRWDDPIFPRTFVEFDSDRYWRELSQSLAECLELMNQN